MTSLLTLVFLALIAFLGAAVFKKLKTENALVNSLIYSGLLYFFLGFLLGPYVFDIINKKIINELNIIYALVLGWAGFMVGLQTNIRFMKRFPLKYYGYSVAHFSMVMLISFVLFYSVVRFFLWDISFLNLWVLSLMGAVTSPILFALVVRDHKVISKFSHLLQFNAAFDNLLGVIIFGIVIAMENVHFPQWRGGYEWLFSAAVATLAVFIFTFLYKQLKSGEERYLLLIGLLLIVDGAAIQFNQSLIFMSFIFGFGLANSGLNTRSLFLDIQKIEKPLYVLLLVFVGVNLTFPSSFFLTLLLLFFFIHLFSKMVSGSFSNLFLPAERKLPLHIGIGNLGLGGLSLAMVLDYYLANQTALANNFLFALTITLIIQDALAWLYLRKVIVRNE